MNENDPGLDDGTEQAEEIFYSTLEIESQEERTAYVEQACAGDDWVRREVERLLNTQAQSEAFFRDGSPSRISAVEISQTLADIPEFFETMDNVLPDDDEVGRQIGNYKLLQKIGEGGGGNVYLAEQEKPMRRQVALKIIKLGMDTKSVIARFEAERQALAMMEHPNIAHVLNAGATETGRPFFVMELVHGVKITTYCDENKLDINQRLELFVQVCHAIQHAHQKGIIHRDIKPSNVLITLHDGVPVPKVIDFGIAKATSGDLLTDQTAYTAQEPFIGTPAYMSPEQADFSQMDIDMRSDVYSLGILLYELLCGQPPFDQKELLKAGVDEMRRMLRDCVPQRPSAKLQTLPVNEREAIGQRRQTDLRRLVDSLSSELDWVVMRALEKDRDRRYQTADGFAEDVLRYLNHEPVVARPPSRRYRFRKLVRRNKGVFASVAAISLTLLAGLGTSSWLFVKERAAREAMELARQNEAVLRSEAETREKISQAAVLISRGKSADADELVGDSPIPVIRPSLEAAGVFRKLGCWNALQGRWPQAAERLLKLTQANRVDQADMTDTATRDLLQVGPTLVAAGCLKNYHALVKETISHFAGTLDPVAAEQVIKISIIAPMDAATQQDLQPLAEVVEQSISETHPKTKSDIYYASWRAFALAWYEYRRGEYDHAVEWARNCLAYQDTVPTRIAMSHTALAMALWQLDEAEEARFELALARAIVERKLPDGLAQIDEYGSDYIGLWHDWVMAYVLLNEASGLIQ